MPVLIALRMTAGILPLPVFLLLVVGLAVPCYRYFEIPMQKWLRSFRRDGPANDEGSLAKGNTSAK